MDCVARDSSSSAIVASAYLDIYEETGDRKYYDYAIELLDALSTDCGTKRGRKDSAPSEPDTS